MSKAIKKKLPNGLTYISIPTIGIRAATFLVLVPVGSRYETKKLSGASHFVEHLMFKGTKKRPSTLDISRELDAVGAHFNAFTDREYTGYYIKIAGEKAELALDILSDMLFNSVFDPHDINKEKGVIIEEIKMYEDNPTTAVELLFEKLTMGDHPLGWDIAGTVQGIKDMTRDELYHYYKSIYVPKNMVLVAAGNVSKETNKLVAKYFGTPKSVMPKITKDKFLKHSWPIRVAPNKKSAIIERKIDQAQVIIGYPGISNFDKRRSTLTVLLSILGGSMSSRLFVEVREKRGLAYRVNTNAFVYRDIGGVMIQAGLDSQRLAEALKVIEGECTKIAHEPVSPKELANAKNHLIGHMAITMEDSSAKASWHASKFWFNNGIKSIDEEIRNIRRVSISDVLKLAQEIFVPAQKRVAVISQLKPGVINKMI